MASLTRDDIFKLASLARLTISDEEATEFEAEINAILEYVEQLQAVDVTSLQPTSQVTGLTNVMRPDELIDYGYKTDALLANVPQREEQLIKVNRMIA